MNKKKVMAVMLATSACTTSILVHGTIKAHASEHKIGHVVNVSTSLRVRSSANTNSKILGYLHNGEKVNIIGKTGSWYKISFNGKIGYVYGSYIKEGSSNNESSTSKISKRGKVVNVETSLRVRSGASTSHSVIGYLYDGNIFNIVGKSGSWYKISFNGKKGYVSSEYVKEISENDNSSNNSSTDLGGKVGQVVNVTTSLRVRSGASTSYSIVGYLSNGEKFDINGRKGDWYKIKSRSVSGYIHKNYAKILAQGDSDDSNNNTVSSSGKGKVINVSSNLRVRNAPSTNSSVVAYLLAEQTFDILGKSGSFYKIRHSSGIGYVHEDYVQVIGQSGNNSSNSVDDSTVINEYGKLVNVSTSLRLRKSPNSSSEVVGYLFPGETFKVVARNGNWYKINSNDKIGYASSEYIKLVGKNDSDSSHSSASFESIYNILKQQIGSPYIWGGKGELITTSSLRSFKNMYPSAASEGKYDIPSRYVNSGYRAFDCSGLMYWGFRQIGINIGGSTYDQVNAGREVSINDARPGDLLFYGNLQHVGMYIGNGQWIESPKSHDYVKIASVPWSRIGRVRRILN